MGELGAKQDPNEKANTERVINALEQHYSDVYGGLIHGDTSGLKKEIATNPFSVGMDVASLAPVVGGATRAIGLPSAIEKAASLADPISAAAAATSGASKLAKATTGLDAGKAVSGAIEHGQQVLTGIPQNLLQLAREAGSSGDPTKTAFTDFMRGRGNPDTIVDTANSAIDEMKQNANSEYLRRRGGSGIADPIADE